MKVRHVVNKDLVGRTMEILKMTKANSMNNIHKGKWN